MAIGDVTNPRRVRMQANERLDTVDADGFSSTGREHLDAWSRAAEAAPRNVGSSTPTGLIFQGFGLTLNPTGGSDSKVRVQSPVGVALDADGRLLIKESGVQVDLTLASGNSQVYVYYVENDSDTTVRRRISVTSPFTESGLSMPTRVKSGVGYFVRAGDQTSIVASDVVNGATTALCFLGVANNAAGVVTMTGYNATTAPNGAFATNRITAVAQPSALPTVSTMSGSVGTMHALVSAALYMVGQALWKGSLNFTPSAANNFGAFTLPTAGVDGLFNAIAEATVTPITRWRDWQGNNRALVDHSGYRMGQVTEHDENWSSAGSRTISWSPMSAGAQITATGGNGPNVGAGGLRLDSTGVTAWAISLSGLRPGMTVTQLQASYLNNNAGNQFIFQVFSEDGGNGSAIAGFKIAEVINPATGGGVKVLATIPGTAAAGFNNLPWTLPDQGALSAHASATAVVGNIVWMNIVASVITDPEGWRWSAANVTAAAGFARRAYSDPSASINQRSVTLSAQGGSGSGLTGALSTEAYVCFLNADVAYVQEWMLATGTISDASNVRLFAVGIQNNNGGAGNRFVYLYNQNTTANWQLRVVGSSTLDTDTGVAIAANTTYRMRLEVLGASVSTAGAGNFRVRAFINGVKVVDVVSTTLPAADMIRPYLQVGTTGATGGPYSYSVGRLRRCWNHLLSGDNL